jgi:hypothetical protein
LHDSELGDYISKYKYLKNYNWDNCLFFLD